MAVDKKATAKTETESVTEVVKKLNFPLIPQDAKRELFFYSMIAVDVFGFRNVERDALMVALAARLEEETGRQDGSFTMSYAERVTYTIGMYFDYDQDTPQEYRNIETWWNMVNSGTDPSECYVYYVINVPNFQTNMYGEAVDKAHMIWKPASQQTIRLEEKAKTDPN